MSGATDRNADRVVQKGVRSLLEWSDDCLQNGRIEPVGAKVQDRLHL